MKTTKEILTQSWDDINRLSTRELRKQLNTLNSAANKRIKNITSKSLYSPAVENLPFESFKTTPKASRNKLISDLSHVSNFLSLKTSTVRGARNHTEFSDQLAEAMGFPRNTEGRREAWRILERYREAHPNIVLRGSTVIFTEIANLVKETGATDVSLLEKIRQSYEPEINEIF